jgi:hypothetical protein
MRYLFGALDLLYSSPFRNAEIDVRQWSIFTRTAERCLVVDEVRLELESSSYSILAHECPFERLAVPVSQLGGRFIRAA